MELVFGTGTGQPDAHSNILNRGFHPAQMQAGVTKPEVDENGKPCMDQSGQPILIAKYSLHALRHFYASWCINRKVDDGLELPIKVVQVRPRPFLDQRHRRRVWPPVPVRG